MGLSNNDIFKKLRVAHQLTNTDIVKICALNGFIVTESELGAIFRREDHPKYVECGDQYLRNFLDGLIIHLRGPKPDKKKTKPKTPFKRGASISSSKKKNSLSDKKKRPRIPKNKPKK